MNRVYSTFRSKTKYLYTNKINLIIKFASAAALIT